MISFRQLLVIALVIGVIWLFYQARRRLRQATEPTPPARFSDMVRCRECGVYLPRETARGDPRQGYHCADTDCASRDSSSR